VVCRDKEAKRQLTRVVRTAEGVVVDPTGKLNGRGAYLCDKTSCWERAVNTEILSKALRITLTAEDAVPLEPGPRFKRVSSSIADRLFTVQGSGNRAIQP
jgi:predicted RNA-binding protein YlxR (DUF448 family)